MKGGNGVWKNSQKQTAPQKQSRSSESLKHHCSVEGNVSTKRGPRGARQSRDAADV